jgi:hypothetical protein
VGRSLALKYTVLVEQRKIANSEKDVDKVSDINDRIEKFETIATRLGFQLLRNKGNKRIGIATIKPSITDIVDTQFSHESFYRILSGIAHSSYTSLMEISLLPVEESGNSMICKHAVPVEIQEKLILHLIIIYCKSVWLRTLYYGLDSAEIALWLEELYDQLKFPDTNESRFWRMLIGKSS